LGWQHCLRFGRLRVTQNLSDACAPSAPSHGKQASQSARDLALNVPRFTKTRLSDPHFGYSRLSLRKRKLSRALRDVGKVAGADVFGVEGKGVGSHCTYSCAKNPSKKTLYCAQNLENKGSEFFSPSRSMVLGQLQAKYSEHWSYSDC
jgi:hypothetical protein